jgi:hypothetical protein
VSSALARLSEGGRLVAITGHNVGPDQPAWRDSFVEMQQRGRVVFTSMIAGQAYARHGTTIETRLTVIDRVPAEDPRAFPPSPGMAADAAELLDQICRLMPPRQTVATPPLTGSSGWLGRFLAPRLHAAGHVAIGLDIAPGADTHVVGSVAERAVVERAFSSHSIEAEVGSIQCAPSKTMTTGCRPAKPSS